MYRILFIATLLLWIVMTVLLAAAYEQIGVPMVSVNFSSSVGVVWLMTGLGLMVIVLRRLLSARSSQEQWIARYVALSTYLNEGVLICSDKGRVRWHNEAAGNLVNDNMLPESLRQLLNRAQSTQRVAIQTVALGEGLRFSVQALPLDRRNYALICRSLQSGSTQNTFYETFIRRIVHDMRNPLAAIIGHAANMRQASAVEPESWRKSAGTIENEAQRLARLVDSMLFDARLAYVPLELQVLDLADVLEEAVYAHDERAIREGKTLEMEVPPGAMRLEGDRDLLTRAFENLVDNSLKYSGTNGHLSVHVQNQPDTYVIQFTDNGEGIPPDYLPDRIFEPLVRARPHGSGSGLGLSIARKIFEMHGGTINAQSKVGFGTTMTVRLPKPDGAGQ